MKHKQTDNLLSELQKRSRRFFQLPQIILVGMIAVFSISILSSAQAVELKIRLGGAVNILDPAFWQSDQESHIIHAIFPKLIEYKSTAKGGTWEWELQLAESIEQVDDTTINFQLKPGFTWTNGYGDITAEDVKYSYERYLDEDLASPIAGDWITLKEVEVTGKYSGVIHLNDPFAPLWTSTLPYLAGSIVSKKATEEAGGKFTTDPIATGGPYKIGEWIPKQRIVLTAHDGWKGKKPAYDKLTLLIISDVKAAEIAFEAGEVDFAKIAISSVPVMKENMPENSTLEIRPSLDYLWLGMNVSNGALQDVRVRQAIKMAVDVDAILEGAYFGIPDRATGFIAPGLIGYNAMSPAPRDVAGAKKLLDDAGVSGLTLELEVSNETDRVTSAQIIQANLAEVGIDMKINVLDGGSFWSLGDTKGDKMQLTLKMYTNPPDPAWATQWFLAEQKGIWNWEWFDNPEFEKLHAQGVAESSSSVRAGIYQEMQGLMDSSAAFLWLMHPPVVLLYRDTVSPGLYPNGRPKYMDFAPAN